MTTPVPPPDPNDPIDPIDPTEPTDAEEREDRRAAIAIVAVLVVALIVGLVWWLVDDDSDETPPSTTTTTSESTTTTESTTTEPEETSSSAPPTTFGSTLSDEELATVVWPDQDSSRRFDDPTAAAVAFATDFVGFTDPVVGEFAQGDSRSGEVEIRPRADGPATTVLVRQLGDDSWWVLGAVTDSIQVTEPTAGTAIDSPLQPEGTSRAFEGTVDVAVFVDGSTEPVGTGFVTGGATEELQPFTGEVTFDAGGARWGAVMFSTSSAENGQLWEAAVVRVGFIGAD